MDDAYKKIQKLQNVCTHDSTSKSPPISIKQGHMAGNIIYRFKLEDDQNRTSGSRATTEKGSEKCATLATYFYALESIDRIFLFN